MNNIKKPAVIGIGVVALLSYIFLPYVSFEFFGQELSISLFGMFTENTSNFNMGFLDILPLLSAVMLIVSGIKGNFKQSFSYAIAGAVSMLIVILVLFGEAGELGLSGTSIAGAGLYIALIAFIAGIIVNKAIKNPEEQNEQQIQ